MRLLSFVFSALVCSTGVHAGSPPGETELLKELVGIPSGSENVAGVDAVQAVISRELKGMGFQIRLVPNPQGANKSGRLLIGTLPGREKEGITFVTHADTVFESGSGFSGFRILSDGNSARGPGAADDKGGIVVAISGLRRYLASLNGKPPRHTLHFLSSPREELGAKAFLPEFERLAKQSSMVLGFEPCIDGSIIDARRGNRWYHIHVAGRESHGAHPAEGVNACHELALKLVALEKLNSDPAFSGENVVTVSIGHIEGGKDKYNIVCGEASAKVDTRFATPQAEKALKPKIEAILKEKLVRSSSGATATTTFDIADESPSFPANSLSKPYVSEMTRILGEVEGKAITSRLSIGSADTNYLYRDDLIMLDGLGGCGAGAHTSRETVSIQSLGTRAEGLAKFLGWVEKK